MKKIEFLTELEEKLQALPEKERKESLEYYAEMIDDHMDEGMDEEEAVAACGSMDDIVDQIIVDTPLTKLVKQKVKPKRKMRGWELALIIAGFPIWFSLLVAVFCVLIAISACLWAVAISFWAVFVACAASSLGVLAGAVGCLILGQYWPALFFLGCALVLAGVALLFFLVSKWSTVGIAKLHKLTFRGIKRCFIRKEAK